ncbi:uncharacterized protein TRAVEDRAFT_88385, partial [Trametes versicolor FP-101664 SS1]|uniref:uncharacterized protein n=1 Tax=Trametes versicolor (strain FP-101664) TaxID=717944 RepID=UPI00046230CF
LNDANLCPGFAFVSTPSKGDKKVGTKEAVDGGLYPVGGIPKPTKSSSTGARSCAVNWTKIEMCIECKAESVGDDPFDESKPNNAPDAEKRQHNLGQILAYAQLVYDNQQRTHQFMLLFLGTLARIVYIDRSGIFATQKFDYKADATYVVEFLWRFARLRDQTKRGHDTTAERIPHHSTLGRKMKKIAEKVADDSKDYAHVQFKKSLGSSSVWWRLTVKDEFAKGEERTFLVGQPHFNAPGVSGRGTRGYIALDYDQLDNPAPKFVYLKDAWRVVHEDIDKEGDTLRTLNSAKVLYVPTVLHHGDLGQFTRSPELWVTYHRDVAPDTRCPLKKHSHYRLVVKEVGRPLEDFYNGQGLVNAIYCCVHAHSEAYAKGIIHRDISVGNMLLYTNEKNIECGLLNDWELSKHVDDESPEGRQLDRTGTWEFLSVFAHHEPEKTILVPDELESFFHALLYMAIRFLPHNCQNVGAFIHDYFEDYLQVSNGDYRCGPAKKRAINVGHI